MSAPPRRSSLRRQLLGPLLWIWVLGSAATGATGYWLARAAANSAFDRGLQDAVTALATKVAWTERSALLDVSRQTMELLNWEGNERSSFALVDERGQVLAGDDQVPQPQPQRQSFERPRMFDGRYRGQPVRGVLFSLASPMLDRSVSLIVVESLGKRRRLMQDVLVALALPTLALGGLSALLLAWRIRRSVRPLREIAHEAAQRAVNDLRPLPLQGVPAEAAPLIERINQLLQEVQQSVALQRRFVADAAHQLRTPVAGLRVLTQELALELGQHPVAEAAVAPLTRALLGSTERMSRLTTQLLSLARAEAALATEGEVERMDIRPLLREAAEPMALRALRAGRSLSLELPAMPLLAHAHPIWLGEALTNVLDNALRYGGQAIVLRAASSPQGVRVEIEDDGPGIAEQDLPRLCEPFWRGERADIRGDGGSGLGLAIAFEIVQRLGGHWRTQTRPEVAGLRISWLLKH
ncbi:sensor histidine kinase N-terminal domain-containing protein [Pelomonas sp. CA6]|uniref:sensor histidine kinase n=1 Tax=Pelomonas sp. CA6 TaxID=2907999 RepID=UPI001F4BE0AF|nr:sensor histidine kinase [Pelomonas sp. CA6]MCH7345739.1 sensor histidine kinase N-terminal domain-containing protein [Pelomonas sp. CA6]